MDLESCKLEIIDRGFPEVGIVRIATEYQKMSDAYFELTRLSRTDYIIAVDKSLTHVLRKVVIGGMSHEIAHISRELSMGAIHSLSDLMLYNCFEWYQTWDERRTDLLVVNRGLGNELLSFLKYANKRREDYTSKEGLTVKELKTLLKQR